MKIAVVYYSLDGNCAFMAKHIAKTLNADIVQVQLTDEKKRRGMLKMFWGVMQTMSGILPAIKPVDFDAAVYDLIILGTPVWASSPAPAIRTFLSQTKISGKKIAIYMCHAGGLGKAMNKFRALLEGNSIVSEIDLNNPVTFKNIEKSKLEIESWAKALAEAPTEALAKTLTV